MKAETLLALTSPQSTRLDAGAATLEEIAQHGKWWQPGAGEANGRMRWSAPKGDRPTVRPQWSLSECAQACSGLSDRVTLALRYSFAHDAAAIWELRKHLAAFGAHRQRAEGWPATVPALRGEMIPYIQRLCDIALIEERSPSRFRGGDGVTSGRPVNIRPILLNVSPDTWRHRLQNPYECLRQEYQMWLSTGARHMRKRLREEG